MTTCPGFTYLASNYSHPDPAVRHARFVAVSQAAAKLMLDGVVVFSPIAHSHCIETIGLPEIMNGDFWKKQDIPILRHAAQLAVLRLPGWEVSKGLAWEMETARALMIPISFIDP